MNPKNPHPPDVTQVMIHSSKITPEVYPGITPFKISPRYIPVYYVLPKYHRGVFSFYIFLCQRRGKVSDPSFEDISPGLASQTRCVNGLWNLHKPLRKTARARVVEGYMRPEICLFWYEANVVTSAQDSFIFTVFWGCVCVCKLFDMDILRDLAFVSFNSLLSCLLVIFRVRFF